MQMMRPAIDLMSKSCSKNRTQPVLIGLAASVLTFGLPSSCVNSPTQPSERKDESRADSKPRETPVPLQWTKENSGKRCNGYYIGVARKGEEYHAPFCHKLQRRLIEASKEGNLPEIREALRQGADPEGTYDDSYPALQEGAFYGHADAVILLLDNGADVNQVAPPDNTALNAVASERHIDVASILLERGADVCYGGKGHTAGDIARSRGYKELAELLKAAEAQKCK